MVQCLDFPQSDEKTIKFKRHSGRAGNEISIRCRLRNLRLHATLINIHYTLSYNSSSSQSSSISITCSGGGVGFVDALPTCSLLVGDSGSFAFNPLFVGDNGESNPPVV
jgi:hypothetical protein